MEPGFARRPSLGGPAVIEALLDRCLAALDSEIEAVKAKPARERLADGIRIPYQAAEGLAAYRFETPIQGLRFAESIRAEWGGNRFESHLTDADDTHITLLLPEALGEAVAELDVEWENDFVLRKQREALWQLRHDPEEDQWDRLDRLFLKDDLSPGSGDPSQEFDLNSAQAKAVAMASAVPVTYIWGPPGTGKTSTLGHVVASFLEQGLKVLLVSTTNRAVDVMVLGTAHALDTRGSGHLRRELCRFGDPALDSETLHTLRYDVQVELHRDRQDNPEFAVFHNRNGMATTLARLATSDLFDGFEADAVVLDEASMATMPSVLLAAAKARRHVVVAGDPMQLPPIAVTDNAQAREFLETDLYALASGAKTPGDLFAWHDAHPHSTCFFDTQYRMQGDLAGLISTVFYAGRLKTGRATRAGKRYKSVRLIDTSPLGPTLSSTVPSGFHPKNQVHLDQLAALVKELAFREQVPLGQIGIIVPFRSVVRDIRARLKREGFVQVEVGTVHTFQGREKAVILFDTVMSGMEERGRVRHFRVRPFDESKTGLQVPRLLNVAFTRAKDRLYILADMDHIRRMYRGAFLGELLGQVTGDS